MIYIGIGSNLNGLKKEKPIENCKKAVEYIKKEVKITKISSWYRSQPIPVSSQQWYVNGVAEISTDKTPVQLLDFFINVEKIFGRVRKKRNESRIIDLDIVDYNNKVISFQDRLEIPHPRMYQRAFVLLPLQKLNPLWTHPKTGKKISILIKELDKKQKIEIIK